MIKDLLRPLFYKTIIKWHKNSKCKETKTVFDSYKNKYTGACFLVGNGPSLKMADLDAIADLGVPCFGMNRIYKVFDSTKWRPTFLAVQDETILMDSCKEIERECAGFPVFTRSTGYSKHDIKGGIFYNTDTSYSNKKEVPPFYDGTNCMFAEGLTIIYSAMQLALYMGFKEVYLIGCDCSYKKISEVGADDYADKRMATNVALGMPPAVDYWFKSYEVAKKYAEEHGAAIYNATRGGMLEVFERKNLDEVLEKLK